MPELPEVETIVKELNRDGILGLLIQGVEFFWGKTLANLSFKEFEKRIIGKEITRVSRRAKFIVITLPDSSILIHLRMSGRIMLNDRPTFPFPYERARFLLSDGRSLQFIDPRKFGRIYSVLNIDPFFHEYGPEPLEDTFNWIQLKEMASNTSCQLKALLLNQKWIAGLGNIYADEALWLSMLHPLRKANSLSDQEIKKLHTSIQQALLLGLESNGATLGSGKTNFYRLDGSKGQHIFQLNVFRKTNHPCKRCGTPILRIKAAGRSTHFCPTCQVLPLH
ncbi:Formamidopyrimidine-DNA glycosylase [Chlamydiales bacterium STE3]|nr:Formamidopyrimidine-DNA glycosylase [Chlamydiales bacterium STE3]